MARRALILSRKTLVEVNLMDMALDALRQRYKFEGFHLVGQSGGGRLVFGLAQMRRDVGCLISTSGGIVTKATVSRTGDPGKDVFRHPRATCGFLAQNRDLRIIVLSDPEDQTVPTATRQTPMVDRLREEGHAAPSPLRRQTHPPKRHGVLLRRWTGRGGQAACRQKSDDEITQAIDKVVSRKAEINQRRQDEARDRTASQTDFRTMLSLPQFCAVPRHWPDGRARRSDGDLSAVAQRATCPAVARSARRSGNNFRFSEFVSMP